MNFGRRNLGIFGSLLVAFIVIPVKNIAAKEPLLEGQVQEFQLAPSTRARPTVTWKNANGGKISLADFDGKVVMVNFWASWCAPCIRELPSIDRLQARLGSDKFSVAAISIDRGGKPVARRMLNRLKLKNLTLYTDRDSTTARSLGVRNMPTTIVYDQKGREVGKLVGGAEWDSNEAVALLKYFINNPNYADKLPVKN